MYIALDIVILCYTIKRKPRYYHKYQIKAVMIPLYIYVYTIVIIIILTCVYNSPPYDLYYLKLFEALRCFFNIWCWPLGTLIKIDAKRYILLYF